MDKKEHSPQAIRLRKFVDKTGLTHTEFGRQCGFKSPRSMQSIYTDGHIPTEKALNKIIARFPQLNYDWVLMGYGEMITKPFVTQPSTDSITKSTGASFNQISKKLSQNDLAVNELGIDVTAIIKNTEHNLLIYTQTMAMLTNKIEQMSIAIKDAQKSLLEEQSKRSILFQKTKEEHVALIKELNEKREKKMASEFFKLSDKVHNHLNESRNLQVNQFKKAQQNYTREMNNKLSKGITLINEAMKKNAIDQTEYAIKVLFDKINPKNLLSKIGKHSLNKKP